MNVLLTSIPRFDSKSGPLVLSAENLGNPEFSDDGLFHCDAFGTELGRTDQAIDLIAKKLAKHWDLERGDRKVQDAAADFERGSLQRVLGPSADIRRGDNKAFIFVPREGRQLAIESKQELPPGWKINSYMVESETGQAQWAEPDALEKVARVDYLQEEKRNGAAYYASKYSYSIPEMWSAGILGEDVVGKRERAAVNALDDFRERVSSWGDPEKELAGAFTLGDALLTGGGQQFKSGSVDFANQMLRLSTWNEFYEQVNDDMTATTLIAPKSDRNAMQNTFAGLGSEGKSVWVSAIEMYPWLRDAIWTNRLNLANETGDASRWMLYTKDLNGLYIEHTESMAFGPFQNYTNFDIVVVRRHGGVINKFPERVVYVDFTT